jgi:hypothetical protein
MQKLKCFFEVLIIIFKALTFITSIGIIAFLIYLAWNTDSSAYNAANSVIATSTTLALISLVLILWQIKKAKDWNKLHFTYTYFKDDMELDTLISKLDEQINFWSRNTPLTDKEVKDLIEGNTSDDPQIDYKKVHMILRTYLNLIEGYCAAINSGIIDSNTAKGLYSYKFDRAYFKSKLYIQKLREIKNNNTIYMEMEKVVNKWKEQDSIQQKY